MLIWQKLHEMRMTALWNLTASRPFQWHNALLKSKYLSLFVITIFHLTFFSAPHSIPGRLKTLGELFKCVGSRPCLTYRLHFFYVNLTLVCPPRPAARHQGRCGGLFVASVQAEKFLAVHTAGGTVISFNIRLFALRRCVPFVCSAVIKVWL